VRVALALCWYSSCIGESANPPIAKRMNKHRLGIDTCLPSNQQM
jgi:hypothetical protein